MESKNKIAGLLRWLARLCGTLALVLGVLAWLGILLTLLKLHMFLGVVTAASLALIAILALVSSVRAPLAIVALVWAALTLYVGFNQNVLMTGGNHWIVEVAHLVLGVGAIGLAEALAAGIARSSAT